MNIGPAGGVEHFFVGGLRPAVADVFHNAAVKQARILRDQRNLPAQAFLGNAGDVLSVNRNFAALDVVIAGEQLDQTRLARSRTADQTDLFAAGNPQIEPLKQKTGAFVVIIDVGKLNRPVVHLQFDRAGNVIDIAGFGQQFQSVADAAVDFEKLHKIHGQHAESVA